MRLRGIINDQDFCKPRAAWRWLRKWLLPQGAHSKIQGTTKPLRWGRSRNFYSSSLYEAKKGMFIMLRLSGVLEQGKKCNQIFRCQWGFLSSSSGCSGHLYLCERGIKPTDVCLGPAGCRYPVSVAPRDAEQKHLLAPGHFRWRWDSTPFLLPKKAQWATVPTAIAFELGSSVDVICFRTWTLLFLFSISSFALTNPGHRL